MSYNIISMKLSFLVLSRISFLSLKARVIILYGLPFVFHWKSSGFKPEPQGLKVAASGENPCSMTGHRPERLASAENQPRPCRFGSTAPLPRERTGQLVQPVILRSHLASARKLESGEGDIKVFTTRPDTLFGCSFFLLAPEYKGLMDLVAGTEYEAGVREVVEQAAKATLIASRAGIINCLRIVVSSFQFDIRCDAVKGLRLTSA